MHPEWLITLPPLVIPGDLTCPPCSYHLHLHPHYSSSSLTFSDSSDLLSLSTMSHAGQMLKKGIAIFNALDEGKPHSSITDWVEVLSSDRYDELSLDGIPELVESINIQGHVGTTVRWR